METKLLPLPTALECELSADRATENPSVVGLADEELAQVAGGPWVVNR